MICKGWYVSNIWHDVFIHFNYVEAILKWYLTYAVICLKLLIWKWYVFILYGSAHIDRSILFPLNSPIVEVAHVYSMYTIYIQYVYSMYTVCIQYVKCTVYRVCSLILISPKRTLETCSITFHTQHNNFTKHIYQVLSCTTISYLHTVWAIFV